jgi:phenylpropionate dioxygenase-like ring-hydroxylating dioxygenase large terminal subunit
MTTVCEDRALLDAWHPIAAVVDLEPGRVYTTQLLGEPIVYALRSDRLHPGAERKGHGALPAVVQYGYVWVSPGDPPHELFAIPECAELDRRTVHAGTMGVAISAPRAVENFLDMGHFPFVHAGILGQAPHTEVLDYAVEVDPITNDLYARNCVFYQPVAAATATTGQLSHYTYRVPHPHCVLLYKTCPGDASRFDVIGLFLHATTAETVRAHNFLSLIDDESTESHIRRFQQHIFGQDKPILENQRPRRLPLDTRAEIPIRADKSSIAYRRWLSDLGITYTTIPVT